MRWWIALTLVLGLGLGATMAAWVPSRATAAPEDPVTDEELKAMRLNLKRLELEVAYLLSREKTMTTYVLEHAERSRSLLEALEATRRQGFTQGAFPAPSREALLAGLEDLARRLVRGLPVITREETALLEEAARLR
jgi:hypothetical protein